MVFNGNVPVMQDTFIYKYWLLHYFANQYIPLKLTAMLPICACFEIAISWF